MAQVIEFNGELVEFPDGMSDAEIASVLQGSVAQQSGPVIGAPQAAQIPGQSMKAPPAPSAAPSGFKQGLLDPFRGGVQLISKGLGALGSDYFAGEAQRMTESMTAEEKAYQEQRKAAGETGFDAARLGGNIVNPASLLGGGGGSLSSAAMRTGIVQGVMQPALDTTQPFALEKAKQAAGGALGGYIGTAVSKLAGKVLNPLASKAEQTMRELGVSLTPGMTLGGQFKNMEAFAAELPLIGSFISNAKERALFSFNKGVINKALSKIDDNLGADVIGRDAVQAANDKISAKYDDVLKDISFKLDFPTYTNLLKSVRVPSSSNSRIQVKDELDRIVYSRFPKDGNISGTEYKAIESDLRKRALDYSSAGTMLEKDVGKALFEALDSLKAGLRRQNPTKTSELRRVDSAYGDISVMKTAAANSGAENGVFTPKQYKTAVRQKDVSRGKTQFAEGKARGQDVAEDAVSIMESTTGSTLSGRIALSNVGGYTVAANPVTALPLALVAPLMYSETGVKAMNTLMRSRPEVARKIGEVLTKRAGKEGSITGANVVEEYNRSVREQQ